MGNRLISPKSLRPTTRRPLYSVSKGILFSYIKWSFRFFIQKKRILSWCATDIIRHCMPKNDFAGSRHFRYSCPDDKEDCQRKLKISISFFVSSNPYVRGKPVTSKL